MSTLTELKNIQQFSGEPRRRWFGSPDMDLIVWFGEDGSPIGFELCYDKHVSEHAFVWRPDSGYGHMAVDDGEQRSALNYKESPVLVADGHIDANRIYDLFEGACGALPEAVVSFVKKKIRQHPAFLDAG